MSGEQNREHSDHEDDDFILEDAPVSDLDDLFQATPQPGAKPATGKQDPSDLLFQTGDAAAQAQFESRPEFAENSPARWRGNALEPDEIGIPVEGEAKEDPLTVEDGIDVEQELEVIGDDGKLQAQGAEQGESFVIDDGQIEAPAAADGDNPYISGDRQEAPVEEGWEPVAPTPGRVADDEAELQTVDEQAQGEESTSAPSPRVFEPALVGAEGDSEIYAEAAAEGPTRTVGAPSRRSRLFTLLPSMAAAALVLGAGAVVVLRPDWLGLHFTPQLVERVQVARPSTEIKVPKPVMPVDEQVTPTPQPVTPVANDPQPDTTKPVASDPQPTVPPDQVQSTVPTQPETTPPETTQPGAATATPSDEQLLPVGETMKIGAFIARDVTKESWLVVKLGSKAFAQLHNGNFFVGSVKSVAESSMILRVNNGEITLQRGEVEKVTALDSEEYLELQKATTGVLRLSNKNRLVGTILESVADDNYVLQMRSDRIVVPKKIAEKIIERDGDQLRFVAGADGENEDAWLREVAARQLRAQANGDVAAPGPESRPLQQSALPKPLTPKPTAPAKTPATRPAPAKAAPSTTKPPVPVRPANGQKK